MLASIRIALVFLVGASALFASAARGQTAEEPTAVIPLPPSAPALSIEAERKSPAAALAWELIPGAGSLYADDVGGAVLTWALIAGGGAAMIWGLGQVTFPDAAVSSDHKQGSPLAGPMLLGGMAAVVVGRVWGFVNAYRAAERYNTALGAQLGMGTDVSLTVAPFISANAEGGVALSGRF
jgi:hypothetical protein